MISTVAVFFLAFSGLFVGRLLARVAPEEIPVGKIYFLFARKIILGVLIALVLLSLSFSFATLIAFFIGLGLGFVLRNIFFFFSILLVIFSLTSVSLFFISAALFFLFFMLLGTVDKNILSRTPIFLFSFSLPFVGFFFPDFLFSSSSILFGTLAGALLFQS